MKESLLCDLFSMSRSGVQKWKREKRPIIKLLDLYFSNEDLQEFLETGKISNFEHYLNFQDNLVEQGRKDYLKLFNKTEFLHNPFIDFYFSFTSYLQNKKLDISTYNYFSSVLTGFFNDFSHHISINNVLRKYKEVETEEEELLKEEKKYNFEGLSDDEIKKRIRVDAIKFSINDTELYGITKNMSTLYRFDNNVLFFFNKLLISPFSLYSKWLDNQEKKDAIFHIVHILTYSKYYEKFLEKYKNKNKLLCFEDYVKAHYGVYNDTSNPYNVFKSSCALSIFPKHNIAYHLYIKIVDNYSLDKLSTEDLKQAIKDIEESEAFEKFIEFTKERTLKEKKRASEY